MNPVETAGALQQRFGPAIHEVVSFRDEVTAIVATDSLLAVCLYCRDDLGFNYLSDLTCTDWLDREPRFDVVYNVMSLNDFAYFRLKTQVEVSEPVPTVSNVWGAANWAEREIWDLFGVEFEGHPDLRRIMLPEGTIGHPLRKDYPQTQITLPRPKVDKTLV
ncbi:MAG: NADH-quinone oxidoreductase subunit C [Chloroflexota bacterium]